MADKSDDPLLFGFLNLNTMSFEDFMKEVDEKSNQYEAEKAKFIKEGNKEEAMYMIGKITGLWESAGLAAKLWSSQ